MARYLTQEWLDDARRTFGGATRVAELTVVVQSVVTGAPGGDIAAAWRLEDGLLTEAELGRIAEPDVTLTATWADAVAIARGELDLSVAFMQGRVKVSGDMGAAMQLLRSSSGPEGAALRDALRSSTEF